MTHQFLYGECRKVLQDGQIDFVFLPQSTKHKDLLQGLKSYRQKKSPVEFDVILIANSYAAELLNLTWMLKAASIPYRSSFRRESEKNGTKFPLLVMGGSNALACQSILYNKNDSIVDALYFGEGEENISKMLIYLVSQNTENLRTKLDSLQDKITGLKVFGIKEAFVQKAVYNDTATEQLASAEQAEFDSSEAMTARLLISYGCHAFCTFCQEGWERKPYREVPLENLISAARQLRKQTGADTLEITSFNFNTYTELTPLIKELNRIFFQVNFMSQRADILAANKNLAAFEAAMGKRQYTIGIEGISQRMRFYFNKNLTEDTIFQCLSLILNQKSTKEIKFFYILSGLETESDIKDFREFLEKIEEFKLKYNTGVRILCSFGLLVRMPFTPLRYEKLILTKEGSQTVLDNVKQTVENAGYEFRLTYPFEEYFFSQTLVLTNNYLATILEEMTEAGFSYNRELPKNAWDFFRSRVFADSQNNGISSQKEAQNQTDSFSTENKQISLEEFSAEKGQDWPFSFNFLKCRITDKELYKRFLAAKQAKDIPTCAAMNNIGTGTCAGCGACTPNQKEFLAHHTINMPQFEDITEITEQVREKARAKPVYIIFKLPEKYASACIETKTSFVMRTLFQQLKDGTEIAMTAKDILFGSDLFNGQLPFWYGESIFAIYPFSNEIRPVLFEQLSNQAYTVFDCIPDFTKQLFSFEFIPSAGINDITSKLEKSAENALLSMHLPYSLARTGQSSVLKIAPKALKKRIITDCYVMDGHIFFKGSQKANFSSLLHEKFTVQTKII